MTWNLGPQNLDWASPSRIFATEVELFDSQPNYEHELAVARDTGVKYQGLAPVVGGWGYATGRPGPFFPPPPPAVNDQFTWVMLEFDGIEGGWHEYRDTNGAGIPRTWTQLTGMGHITNVGEKFYPGALYLDGKTVITAPDMMNFKPLGGDFTIRGFFTRDFPASERRVLAAKSDGVGNFVFLIEHFNGGFFSSTIEVAPPVGEALTDRFAQNIVDRFGNVINASGGAPGSSISVELVATNLVPGWNEFVYYRSGHILGLRMNGVEASAADIGTDMIVARPGPLTIGGYFPPISGVFQGNPWIGLIDRFAIDLGIAR